MKPISLTGDIPDLAHHWRNNPKIYAWCRQPTLLNQWEHESWLAKIETDKSIKMFGILDNKLQAAVGVCGLTSIDHISQKAEFSLYIDPEAQKRGHGRAALLELLRVGFYELNLNRIWGETFEHNPAANLFEDIGMIKEGILRQSYFKEGRRIDSFIYSMLRSEYEARYNRSSSDTTA